MAERVRAKRDEDHNPSEKDPLSELADIMGLSDEQQLGIGLDEIELELERELLGDTDDEPQRDEVADAAATESDDSGQIVADDELTDELAGFLADSGGSEDTAEPKETFAEDEKWQTAEPTGDEPDEERPAAFRRDGDDSGEGEASIEAASPEDETDDTGPSDTVVETDNADGENEGELSDVFPDDDSATDIRADDDSAEADPLADIFEHAGYDRKPDTAFDDRAEEFDDRADERDSEEDAKPETPATGASMPWEGADADERQELERQLEALLGGRHPGKAMESGHSRESVEREARADSGESVIKQEIRDDDDRALTALEADKESAPDEAGEESLDIDLDSDELAEAAFAEIDDDFAVSEEFLDAEIEDSTDEMEIVRAFDDDDELPETVAGDSDEPVSRDEDVEGGAETETESAQTEEAGGDDTDIDDDLIAVFGDMEKVAIRSREESEPAAAEDDSRESDEDHHIDERVATLFGRATPQPVDQDRPEIKPSEEPQETVGGDNNGGTAVDALAALERVVADLGGKRDSLAPLADDESGISPPEIETVDIEEGVPAAHNDLDIPDVPLREETVRQQVFDDLESEIAAGFDGPPPLPEPEKPKFAAPGADPMGNDFDSIFDDDFAFEDKDGRRDAGAGALAAGAAATLASSGGASAHKVHDRWSGDSGDALAGIPAARKPVGRSALVGAVVAGVAILGGIGIFAFSYGGGGPQKDPVVIKAGDEPVKVKPADPGGKTVPNQDNKVYERVSGDAGDTAPSQKTLVTTAEEPVDVGTRAPESQTSVQDEIGNAIAASEKSEDRLLPGVETAETPAAADDDVAVLAPRRVRTMVVKPDGTLVPREETEPAVAEKPAEAPIAAATPNQSTGSGIETPVEKPADPKTEMAAGQPVSAPAAGTPKPAGEEQTAPAVSPDSAKELEAAAAKAEAEKTAADARPAEQEVAAAPARESTPTELITPERAPIVPSRPADQPVNVVGTTRNAEVRSAGTSASSETPVETAAAAQNGYSVQIASQPSREAAQQTYAALAQRFGSILGGREMRIIPAEIEGRGTYYRVRVPAQSRADANDLCARYKTAGGDCFVTR